MTVSLDRVKFGIFLALQIPSLSCSLYLFFQYLTRENLRQSVHNHVVIVLLCSSFVFVVAPLSVSEAFFFTSHVRPESDLFCAFWTWIHYSINISNLMIMAFACAERHWLVFRLNALYTRRRRLFYHYIPITVCAMYPWLFYFVFIFLYSCESTYDYTEVLCVMPCYFTNNVISNVDTLMNNWLPIVAIPLFSAILLIRVFIRKRQLRVEVFRWKRDRKMIMELLSISLLYVLIWGPPQAAAIYDDIFTGGQPSEFELDYFYVFPYLIHLLYPFVLLISNPELRWKRRRVLPQLKKDQLPLNTRKRPPQLS